MSNEWKETSNNQLLKADLVVFIGKKNYEYCRSKLSTPKKYKIWDLPDFDDANLNGKPLDIKREIEYLKLSENIFILIKRKVDKLITNITD
ncbi:MAG TPA: hypothetical protein VMY36_03690 [Patescibacteria group bacterium]|nr:hypothetical protein [Patescibacteria group bacterium]